MLTPHYRFMLWLLLRIAPTTVLADQYLTVERDIDAELDPAERRLHAIFRNRLAGELHRRAVNRNERIVSVNGLRYSIEPRGTVTRAPFD